MIRFILLFIMAFSIYSFDGVEVEQLLFVKDKVKIIDELIRRETNTNDLASLKELKLIILRDDHWEFSIAVKKILEEKQNE